jgi:rsbT co-antagonist protein RsbR
MGESTAASKATLETQEELDAAIAQFLGALSDVEEGTASARVKLEYSDAEPLRQLADRVNAVLGSLHAMRAETLSYQKSLEEQISTIEKQRAAIRELSTPIIEVWQGVLCVPIVGILDSSRASDMSTALLTAVVEKKVVFTIIDITGIDAMDTSATDHFLRMARAVKLLGAECVLSGVNPNVARTIVHMGIDLAGVQTHRTLREALQSHVQASREEPSASGNEEQATVSQ